MRIIVFSLFFLASLYLSAQDNRRANWVIGKNYPENGTGTILRFNQDTFEVSIENGEYTFASANTSISDSIGNLLLYSNGCEIRNVNHDTLKNGGCIAIGLVKDVYCNDRGSPFYGTSYFAPSLSSNNIFNYYQLTSLRQDLDSLGQTRLRNLLITKSVLSHNNDSVVILEKNKTLLESELSNNGFQIIKSYDNKNWWLIIPEYNTNCYYVILDRELEDPIIYKQCLGRRWGLIDRAGQSLFSPNGEIYVRYQIRNGLHVFNFDRCLGILSNPKYINLAPDTAGLGGAAISPNSRFLYTSNLNQIFQYDLWADSIIHSKSLIDTFDGVSNPNRTNFYRAQLAPDGKIYWNTLGATFNMHVIDLPNNSGRSCSFRQRGVELPFVSDSSIPNFPNYSLGVTSTQCDNLYFDSELIAQPSCFQASNGSISLIPQNGQAPYSYQWSDGSNIDSSRTDLSPNLYTCSITDATGRTLIKQIDLQELPELKVELDITNANSGQSNGIIRLSPSGGLAPYSFAWNIAGQMDAVVTDLPAGNYSYTVTDANGCTLDGEAVIDQLTNVASVFEAYQFTIYPNPTKANVQVELTTADTKTWSLELFSSLGRKVEEWRGKGNNQFVIEKIPSGVYWLVLKGEGWSEARRVVVLK